MQVQYYWWLLALGLVVAELFTGTFYLLILALGALAAGFGALYGLSLTMQLLVAALVVFLGWAVLSLVRKRRDQDIPADSNPDVLLDVGSRVQIDEWTSPRATSVRYRGAQWAVKLADSVTTAPQPGHYQINAVRGSTLIVVPAGR